jgi:hypothetical protein
MRGFLCRGLDTSVLWERRKHNSTSLLNFFSLSARTDHYVDILSCSNVFVTHVFFSPDFTLSLNYEIPVEGGMRKVTLGLKGKICVAGEM